MDEYETVQAFGRLGGEHAARVAAGDPADPEASFQEWLRVCWPLVSRTREGRQHLQRMQELSTHSHDVHAVHATKNLEARPLRFAVMNRIEMLTPRERLMRVHQNVERHS